MNTSSNLFDFNDKTVVVIGGTSGINLGIAEMFARAGARIAVASRSQDKVDAAVQHLRGAGAAAVTGFNADVRDMPAIEAGLKDVHGEMGLFDVLVSGAAGNFPARAADMSSNAFKSVVDIDLLGTFNVARAAHEYLQKPGAAVINISAPQAFIPMAYQVHACAAKAGVDMVTRVLAIEWGGEGIRVNSIVPGPIEGTEGMRRLAPTEEMKASVLKSVPLNRYGTSADIAYITLFLASDFANYLTGAVIPVDGGWSLKGANIDFDALVKSP